MNWERSELNQPSYNVLAVLTGKPQPLEDGKGHVVTSAINKSVITDPVFLTQTHFNGDVQADTKNHGGVDKAVLAYSYDHYPFWNDKLGQTMEYGAFGENLTIEGATEETIHIGDTFQLDGAVIQVTQPRQPCFKLAFKHRVKEMPLWVEESGRSGIYFRVLQEGQVSPRPKLILIRKGEDQGWSLAAINKVLFSKTPDIQDLKAISKLTGIAGTLKQELERKVERLLINEK